MGLNIRLSKEEMLDIIENESDCLVVDVRSEKDFDSNHFIGAINIPLETIENIKDNVKSKETNIFLYCASGIISDYARIRLSKLGYKNAYNLGGLYKYNDYIYIK